MVAGSHHPEFSNNNQTTTIQALLTTHTHTYLCTRDAHMHAIPLCIIFLLWREKGNLASSLYFFFCCLVGESGFFFLYPRAFWIVHAPGPFGHVTRECILHYLRLCILTRKNLIRSDPIISRFCTVPSTNTTHNNNKLMTRYEP